MNHQHSLVLRPLRNARARRGLAALCGVGVLTLFAGCSPSGDDYKAKAEELIEGELSDGIGLGDLTASCADVPKDIAVGGTFECTGTSPDGTEVEFVTTIEEEKKISVDSANLITPDGLATIEQAALNTVGQQFDLDMTDGAIDCGEAPRVFDPATETLDCVITDPTDGTDYEATIELSGLDADATFNIEVGDPVSG